MNHREACRILEISENASKNEIKDAYKKLAKVWHPDKHRFNKSKAEEQFKKISEAYAILTNQSNQSIEQFQPFHHPDVFFDMTPMFMQTFDMDSMFETRPRRGHAYVSQTTTTIQNGRRVTKKVEIRDGVRIEETIIH